MVTVKSRSETAAKNSLDVWCIFPVIEQVTNGKVKLVPKFPGYVYVQHDGTEDFFARVAANKYVTGFLESSLKAVDQEDMAQILTETPKTILMPGDGVKITEGLYRNMFGIIKEVDRENCMVSIPILGIEVRQKFSREHLIRST